MPISLGIDPISLFPCSVLQNINNHELGFSRHFFQNMKKGTINGQIKRNFTSNDGEGRNKARAYNSCTKVSCPTSGARNPRNDDPEMFLQARCPS